MVSFVDRRRIMRPRVAHFIVRLWFPIWCHGGPMVCRCSCLSLHQVISGSARLQFEVEVISEISRCSDAWLVTCMLSVLHGTLFETTVEFLVFKFVRFVVAAWFLHAGWHRHTQSTDVIFTQTTQGTVLNSVFVCQLTSSLVKIVEIMWMCFWSVLFAC